MPKRVANRIVLLVLTLELLSILVWGSFTYSASKQELLKSISSQLSEVATRTTTEIGSFFLPITIETSVMARTIDTEAIKDVKNVYSVLISRLFHARPELEEISFLDSSGFELKRMSRMLAIGDSDLRNFENDILINNALIGVGGFDSIAFSQYLEPTIRFATPVNSTSKNHDIRAILTKVNLKWLWDTVQSLKVGKRGYVYVIDEALKLIAYPDPSMVLQGIYLPQTRVHQSLFIDEGQRELLFYENFSGVKVAGVSRYDPLNQWWVVVEQPVSEGLAPLDRVINRFIIAFLSAATVTIFVVVFFSKITMRPLVLLEQGIARLARGERNVRVSVSQHTELSTLADAFNTMAQNLDVQTSRLEYQALHDSLTGLPNRQYLFNQLEKLQELPIEKIEGFSLLLLDLDRFKEVNDSLGHKYGDILLKQLRPRLLEKMVNDDLLARLGGDEFAILISSPRPIDEVVSFVRCIRRVIQEPFEIEGIRIQIDVSVGIAQFPEHGKDGSTLLRHADIAMYQAKHHGQGWALYDQKQDVNSPKRLALMSGLRNAITENELVLYYQPKITIADRSIRCMEALIRWQHPDLGLLPPEQFIPIGELGKLINPLTIWVLDKAIADCKLWHNLGYHLTVAINVSALNIQDFELVDKIKVLLGKHNFEAKYLQLEITESVIMSDAMRAQKAVKALVNLGVSVAIDDFGTGYSSLAYIKQLPVNELKIDKSFVMDMHSNENDAVIVRSTIDLAHNLGLQVTAEGVEVEEVYESLKSLKCDFVQGFLFCPPIAIEETIHWLESWHLKLATQSEEVAV